MSINIDTETAKLAGLQIDFNTKLRKGKLTLLEFEAFLNMKPGDRQRLFGSGKYNASLVAEVPTEETAQAIAAPFEKFAVLKDLGEIVVPDDYDHATALAKFKKEHGKKFCYFNDHVTDKNFGKPSRILKPGDRLRVQAHHQVVGGDTTSEERMAYLAKLGSVHTGAQGASLVFEQKRGDLPKGKWYASFDDSDRLPLLDGNRRVPGLFAYSDGVFGFDLGNFEKVWLDGSAFLSFSDVEKPSEA